MVARDLVLVWPRSLQYSFISHPYLPISRHIPHIPHIPPYRYTVHLLAPRSSARPPADKTRKTRALKKTLFWSCKLRNPFINVKGEYRANTLQISCEYFAKVVNPCDGARTTAEPVIGSRVHSHFATATTGAARAHERARARVSGPIPLHLRYLPISRHIPPWI